MREALRKVLPPQAFLKRDRGDALFITNAPLFDPSIKTIPGFVLIPGGKLTRLLPDTGWVAEFEQGDAPDQFSASLLRFRGLEPDMDGLRICAQGIKLIDAGPSAVPNEIEAYERSLRNRAALALRGAASGGGLYAAALINHQIHKGE